ncbi:MAG: NAD-binding protein [Salinisphaera sp.]|jgi:voltage-gated potassium channel|nr:NAD-binding protein [Salinisphaera sp.]
MVIKRIHRFLIRLWRTLWPHIPIGLFLVLAGAMNVIAGVQAPRLFHFVAGTPLPELGQQVSLGVLGSGAQVVFGCGLIATGIGVFWRVRIAWTFAVLLLLITIGINVAKFHFGSVLVVPGVVLFALFAYKHHFQRRTMLGNSLMSLVGVFSVLAYGTLGLYLLGSQFDPAISTLTAALYFLVETLTTTGYGDYHPVTPLAQGYMITLWVFGLSVFATALASIAGSALAGHLTHFITPGGTRRMEKNHVILMGAGLVATNTAHELLRRGLTFVQLVDSDEEPPLSDQPSVRGDTSDDKVLHKAGISKARLLIAADDDDGENAFICLAAKDINPDLKVLAVASSRRAIRRLKLARADVVFAPIDVGTRLLANLVEGEELPAQFRDLLGEGEPE